MALQFQAPFNYQPDLRSTSDRINQLGDTLNKIGNQALERRATMAQIAALYQQRQAEGVKSLASLYDAGGPDAVSQLGGNLAGSMGIDLKGLNYQSPPMSQPPTPSGLGNDQSPSFPQGSSSMNQPIYQTPIHASVLGQGNPLNTDHPDYADLANRNTGSPDFSGAAADIGALTNRMDQFQGRGSFGAKQQAGLKNQIDARKALLDAQMAPLNYAQKEKELQLSQTKPIAEEVSKQTQSADETRQLRGLYNNLQSTMAKTPSSIFGNISGGIAQQTGGRYGSKPSQDMLNAANPLATALNTVLSRRFNSGEVQMLSNALIPQPKDLPEVRAQKMQKLGQMISTMENSNEQNIRNVGTALMGGVPSLSQSNQSPQSADVHSTAVAWAKANPQDPRATKILALNGGGQ